MKTVLITGSSSGIGKASVQEFLEKGWNVAATMRDLNKSKELPSSKNLKTYTLDVTDPKTVKQAVNGAINDFGKIDVLVNNAGYGVDGVFEAMDDQVIRHQFDTNVLGLMRVTRAVIPHFRNNGGGKILQISSMGGRITLPLYSIYHGTKWAVEGFSESLHYELKPFNIRVKIIEPGVIKTEFYGRNRKTIMRDDLTMYKNYVDKVARKAAEGAKKGIPPGKVAKTVRKAATDNSRKLRYTTGFPAPLLVRLRKLLPGNWFYKLIRSQME